MYISVKYMTNILQSLEGEIHVYYLHIKYGYFSICEVVRYHTHIYRL